MIVVYAGPTITHDEVREHCDCVCLPPVSQGDILDILPQKPQIIAIVDGYFEGVPSVWHKEILFAMDQGVAVYGCSSMGALRAAELSAFGMVGVGRIYEWFRDGTLTDDDEVAVLHGPEEAGFVVASEPMVNIRATLDLARRRGVIDDQQKQVLLSQGKALFYKQRSWSRLFEQVENTAERTLLCDDTRAWLTSHRVNLKQQDAIEMLNQLNRRDDTAEPIAAAFHFEWTHVWDSAYQLHKQATGLIESVSERDHDVLNQLRLCPDQYARYHDKALLAWLCSHSVELAVEDADLKKALSTFKQTNRLASRQQVIDHAERIALTEAQLVEMLENAALVEEARDTAGTLQTGIVEQLKLDGYYLALEQAVARKQDVLAAADLASSRSTLIPAQVLAWYFEQELGTRIPTRMDSHLNRIGMDCRQDFDQLIAEHYLYRSVGQ